MLLTFADIVVDTRTMRVTRAGRRVVLEPRAFDLLVYLARRPGDLVEKETLIRDVWGGTAVTDNAITRVVAQLRRALGDSAQAPRLIETVPTRGYRFLPDVAAGEPEAGRSGAAVAAASPRRREGAVRAWLSAAALAALVVAAWGAWLVVRAPAGPDPDPFPPPALAAPPSQLTVSSGLDLFPAVSPDGSAVAYASDRTGRFEIVVRALAPGGGERLLTTDGLQNVQPSWSPDGRALAFHARTPGGIWIVSSQGGTPRQVSPVGSAPAWSPDGAWIAYQSQALTDLAPSAGAAMPPSTIWIVPPAGGAPRPLTRPGRPEGGHGRPVWSRDGREVLFASGGPMVQDLWIVPVSGGAARLVVGCEKSCLDPLFGPDGHLYYADATAPRLWQLPLDAATRAPRAPARSVAVAVSGTVRGLSFSADGRVAAFASVDLRSHLMSIAVDAAGEPLGPPRPLTNDRSRRNTLPSVSPDGQRIAYIAGRGGAAPDVWLMNRDGSDPEQLTVDRGGEERPMWSSDGRTVLFRRWRADRLTLRAVDLATRRERDVLDVDRATFAPTGAGAALRRFTMRASPDVSRLAFTSPVDGIPNIFATTAAAGEPRQLTHDGEGVSFPVFSPAADLLAVQAHRGADTHAALVPAAGGSLRLLTRAPGQTWVHDWSADGALISAAVLRAGVWNVAVVSRATGAERLLTRDVSPRTYVRYPAWSPRGDFLAYERAEVGGNIWVGEAPPAGAGRAGIW